MDLAQSLSKYELKSLFFLAKFERALSLTRTADMLAIFLLLKNPFKINQ